MQMYMLVYMRPIKKHDQYELSSKQTSLLNIPSTKLPQHKSSPTLFDKKKVKTFQVSYDTKFVL